MNVGNDASSDALETTLEKNAASLHELRRQEMRAVTGGDCSPSYIDICIFEGLARLLVAIADTAPASSYAYGKVGYTS